MKVCDAFTLIPKLKKLLLLNLIAPGRRLEAETSNKDLRGDLMWDQCKWSRLERSRADRKAREIMGHISGSE